MHKENALIRIFSGPLQSRRQRDEQEEGGEGGQGGEGGREKQV